MKYIVKLEEVGLRDISIVGGKNASLGEMLGNLTSAGLFVPTGFATTVKAYRDFLESNALDGIITSSLNALNIKQITSLNEMSHVIRSAILSASFSKIFEEEIAHIHSQMTGTMAVRSSATAEDLATVSFAGQQETFLNVKGFTHLLRAIKKVYASLFTSRAIAYRNDHGFDHLQVGISVGIQPMIRSDKAASGVIFTIDTESGFDQAMLISSSYGLGETIVQGQVNPDEFVIYKPALAAGKQSILYRHLGSKAIKMIYSQQKDATTKLVPVKLTDRKKFSISDADIIQLATYAKTIEEYYQKPMDIEWAKDGITV